MRELLTDVPGEFEQDITTACYLCHGQCANFGVHGKGVRPCAKGVSEIINRRREARITARINRAA